MAAEDGLEVCSVERAGLNKLEETGFVLGAPRLERDGGEVFGSEDAGGCSVHIFLHSSMQRIFHQRSPRRQA